MSVPEFISIAISRSRSVTQRAAFLAPLLARATVGYAFVESGWGKVQHLDKVAEYFMELGIPAPAFQAGFVAYIELICGTLVLIGALTRLAAVPLIGTMVVALITAKASEIGGWSDLIGTIEFCYAVLLAWLALAGAGPASLDHVIARRVPRPVSAASVAPASLA